MSKILDENKTDQQSKKYAVFISHSSKDALTARKLANNCEKLGLHTYIDKDDIKSGTNWRLGIENAINSCAIVIVIVSKAAVLSDHTNYEWSAICEEKWNRPEIKIIPLKIDNIKVPPFLCKYRSFDVNKEDSNYEILLNYIQLALEKQETDISINIFDKNYESNLKDVKERYKRLQKTLEQRLLEVDDQEVGRDE